MAHLEPELYRQFYAIELVMLLLNKWDDYELILDKNILNKIKNFVLLMNMEKVIRDLELPKMEKVLLFFIKKMKKIMK